MGQPESSSLREDNLCNRHTERNLKITSCVREVWDQGYLCWDMLISPVHKNGLAGVPQFFNFLQNYNFRFTDISLKGNLLSIMSRSFPDQKSQIKNYHWSWKGFVKEWKNCLLFTNQAKKWKRFLRKNCWVCELYVNFARIFIALIFIFCHHPYCIQIVIFKICLTVSKLNSHPNAVVRKNNWRYFTVIHLAG